MQFTSQINRKNNTSDFYIFRELARLPHCVAVSDVNNTLYLLRYNVLTRRVKVVGPAHVVRTHHVHSLLAIPPPVGGMSVYHLVGYNSLHNIYLAKSTTATFASCRQ